MPYVPSLKNKLPVLALWIIIAFIQWTVVNKPSVHKRSLVSKTTPLSPIVLTIKDLNIAYRHFRSRRISTGLSSL